MLIKLGKGVVTACSGIAHSISKESNIKIQFVIALIVILIASLLDITRAEFAVIIVVAFFVIILEMVNTSIEKLIDKISPDFDRDYGKIKDMMGGAVLLSAVLAIIVAVLILVRPVLAVIVKMALR
jgi:diacylglycerol kinase